MTSILIIEDDQTINGLMYDILTKNGYSCTRAYSGTEGYLLLEKSTFGLILLDLMLPGLSGETLIAKIRAKCNTPVIVVSAKDALDSKVNMLTLGADDYITKPFEIQELLVRVMAQLRRSGAVVEQQNLTFRDLTLNKDDFSFTAAGEELLLTKQEFKIMELLMTYPSKVFSKQEIYEYAWDSYYIGEDKTINVHISNIRQKLKKVSSDEYIETVWGIGFRLCK